MKNNTIINIESSTSAIKAKKLLTQKGYTVKLEKQVDGSRGGCKSKLIVNGEEDTVCRILNEYGIQCR